MTECLERIFLVFKRENKSSRLVPLKFVVGFFLSEPSSISPLSCIINQVKRQCASFNKLDILQENLLLSHNCQVKVQLFQSCETSPSKFS
jgi:hypothetical protein